MAKGVEGLNEVDTFVRLTTRQVEKLAQAAGVTIDDVRRAARMMQSDRNRRDFLHTLGYVHASVQPEFKKLAEGPERYMRVNQTALDLKSVWLADADVRDLVRAGLDQGRTNTLPKNQPGPFTAWLDRVKSFNQPTPEPAMMRI